MSSLTSIHESELLALVRDGDYDRFLAIQLAPKAKRAGLYALTAFHVELARIAHTVSEPLIGHIRLAWWREGLEELADDKTPRSHPVLMALAVVLKSHPELLGNLTRMVGARAADFDDSLLTEELAWFNYCDATAGALHAAWAQLLDAEAAIAHRALIASQARAYAMIGLVRHIPLMVQRGSVLFPQSRLVAHGVSSLAPSPELYALAGAIIDEAMPMVTGEQLGKQLLPLIGCARLATSCAQRLRKARANPYQLSSNKLDSVWQITKITFL